MSLGTPVLNLPSARSANHPGQALSLDSEAGRGARTVGMIYGAVWRLATGPLLEPRNSEFPWPRALQTAGNVHTPLEDDPCVHAIPTEIPVKTSLADEPDSS